MSREFLFGKGKTKQGTTKYKQIQNKEELEVPSGLSAETSGPWDRASLMLLACLRGGGLAQVKPTLEPGSVLHYQCTLCTWMSFLIMEKSTVPSSYGCWGSYLEGKCLEKCLKHNYDYFLCQPIRPQPQSILDLSIANTERTCHW